MKKLYVALACTAALCAMPASAAVVITVDDVTLEDGPPFDGGGANPTYDPTYNNDEPAANTVTGDLSSGPALGPLVTFSSSSPLDLFGSTNGFAQIDGPFTDITIDPDFLFTAIDFVFSTDPGADIFADVTVFLDGGSSVLFDNVNLLPGNEDRWRIYGTNNEAFTSVNFDFTGDVKTLRQVQFQRTSLTSGVPEPTTWAMLLVGFGAIGASLRKRKSNPRLRLQAA